MVFILGASSLHRSLEKLCQVTNQKLFDKNIIAVPGLNLHPGSKAKLKAVQNCLGEIPVGETIILWHDVINNSIAKHTSDPRQPLSADGLSVLQTIRVFVSCIVYCQRKGAADVFEKLCSTRIPTLHIIKDLLSKKKQKDTKITPLYSEFCQY